MVDYELEKRILALRERVVADFDAGDWEEIGLLTGFSDLISGHPRLLRSLSWGDEDYAGNALTIIKKIAELDENAERGPLLWTGKLMLLYQLVRRIHETYPSSYFHRRI